MEALRPITRPELTGVASTAANWSRRLESLTRYNYGDTKESSLSQRFGALSGIAPAADALTRQLSGIDASRAPEAFGKLTDYVKGLSFWSRQGADTIHGITPNVPIDPYGFKGSYAPHDDVIRALSASSDAFSHALSDARDAAAWAQRILSS
jgi:hypothetical protein